MDEIRTLDASQDFPEGVYIDPEDIPDIVTTFITQIRAQLSEYEAQKASGRTIVKCSIEGRKDGQYIKYTDSTGFSYYKKYERK